MPSSADYDTPWKEILTRYFPEFMAFFFPAAHGGIDWSRGHVFLDKELRQVTRDAKLGRRLADKLAKVWRRDGGEAWVLVHPEIQGQPQEIFAKRMDVYNYRIFDRHDRRVMSCAVLTDDRADWRPDRYGYELWGCELGFRFPVAKVLDYGERWEALEQDRNPSAVVVMAHLKARETRDAAIERAWWKFDLVRRLYNRGYARQQVIDLFRFIDWLMQLPEELEQGFFQQLAAVEEDTTMPYVSSVERIGRKKGLEQGLSQGLSQGRRETQLAVASRLLGILDDEAIATSTGLSVEEVRAGGLPAPAPGAVGS
ncbi:MAG: cytosolic protein [Thermodesulfobacteriota bacterium]